MVATSHPEKSAIICCSSQHVALNYHFLAPCVTGTPVLQCTTGRQDPVRGQRRRAGTGEAAAATTPTARQRGTLL